MKRKIFALFTALGMSLVLSSCGGLSIPTGLVIEERLLTWNEVRGAEGYRVLINEEDQIDVHDNALLLEDEYFGSMSFQVAAMGKGNVGDYSSVLNAEVFLNLDAPSNVRQEGDLLIWDEVAFASGYVVKVGTAEHTTTVAQYQITVTEPIQVAVLANGSEDGYVLPSSYSENYLFKVALASPTNITYGEGLLTWSAVTNAASYQISINNGTPFSSSTNQYQIGYDYVGLILFKVKSISGNDSYLDSAYAEQSIQINALTLQAPENLVVNGNVLSFDNVEHAMSYGIYHNGEFVEEIATNGYTIPSEILAQSGSYLQVQALSTIHNDSELSAKVYLGAIEIDSEAELRAMESSGYYTLTSNIILTQEWTPLSFTGIFDGGNNEISGLSIDGERDDSVGLFSNLEDAQIKDLRLVLDCALNTTAENVGVGALAGVAKDSVISNVEVNGSLEVTSNNGIINFGGLVGLVNGGSIDDCRSIINLNGTNAISGGLVGKVASNTSAAASITNSGFTGTIMVAGGEQSYAGGFVGMLANNNATISASRAFGSVSGTSYVGGFVGYMALGSIDNCYSRGPVYASSATLVHAGGFAGRVEGYNNHISYSIGMAKLMISQSGENIYVGSFAGVTPGGSYANIYSNCHYDSTISNLDRIGNTSTGRGDGITGLSSSALLMITTFNTDIWSFAGEYPTLIWEA